ncbi:MULTISPECIES: carboxymuconolactone decarboxylase family protein [unclassified Acinetobacter]|uniref:carboxymuconolactone decarboxylase family protein n=1 Tax=unclassified Acinetobacter TaxID=196816 RepID=UPI00257770BD|nr:MULTISPECIES: carboxymuconolactone decarboxylase family protein [unclassified Acinetobacter]MDM1763967.1 carboxymuconolactone decarboxylase family protein [Acinetobacter sp. 226-1]MDM1767701.1 carboxymuconolactone decarboxylase family protein [Acinetobacter sp. 226-4]
MQRINLSKTAPELYKTVIELENLSMQKVQQAGIEIGFSHLLKLRASQINQCAFCVRMHTQDAIKVGESLDRIALISAWRESEYFSVKERAALTLIEEITLIAQQHFPDAAYEQAANVLSSDEITAIEWIAIVINTWNRIAISSQYKVAP